MFATHTTESEFYEKERILLALERDAVFLSSYVAYYKVGVAASDTDTAKSGNDNQMYNSTKDVL